MPNQADNSELTAYRLDRLEDAVESLTESLTGIKDSLATLVRIELNGQEQTRLLQILSEDNKKLKDNQIKICSRVSGLELKMQGIFWVIGAAAMSLIGIGVEAFFG